jgi:hypothetical protein
MTQPAHVRYPFPSPLQLVSSEMSELPDAYDMASVQGEAAIDLLQEDKSLYARFRRLQGIDRMAGSMAPGEIWMVGAQTGSGKSLLCQNLMDDLIAQEIPTLYIGTEQDVEVLKIKHSCIRAGVSPRLILKPHPEEVATTAYQAAQDAVRFELRWMRSNEIAPLALFANTEYVNRDELVKWIDGGVKKYNIGCVIVDHIDQVDHGTGINPIQEATGTLQLLHTQARRHQIPIVVASQVKRRSDAIRKYAPPEDQDFAGTSGKERIASVMLGLWRPLRTDMAVKELRELLHSAKHGNSSEDRVYQPGTMGVRLLKDRLGEAPGKQCLLSVCRGGKLEDDPATTHGIRTRERDFGK